MKRIHKRCDHCNEPFRGYRVNLGVKGMGDGVGKTNLAYFYFCDLLCASKFLKHISYETEIGAVRDKLMKAGV